MYRKFSTIFERFSSSFFPSIIGRCKFANTTGDTQRVVINICLVVDQYRYRVRVSHWPTVTEMNVRCGIFENVP